MKKSQRIISLSLLAVVTLCVLMTGVPYVQAARIQPMASATVAADLSRSGYDLYKYGRVTIGKVETVYYTVVLQQKEIWPWAAYTDYEAYSGKSATGSMSYGETTSPPTGYYYRVAVYASSASFPDISAVSNEIFY